MLEPSSNYLAVNSQICRPLRISCPTFDTSQLHFSEIKVGQIMHDRSSSWQYWTHWTAEMSAPSTPYFRSGMRSPQIMKWWEYSECHSGPASRYLSYLLSFFFEMLPVAFSSSSSDKNTSTIAPWSTQERGVCRSTSLNIVNGNTCDPDWRSIVLLRKPCLAVFCESKWSKWQIV